MISVVLDSVSDLFTWTNLITSELVPSQPHVTCADFIKIRGDLIKLRVKNRLDVTNERNHIFRVKNRNIQAHRFLHRKRTEKMLSVFQLIKKANSSCG